jgi:hypothetical protein
MHEGNSAPTPKWWRRTGSLYSGVSGRVEHPKAPKGRQKRRRRAEIWGLSGLQGSGSLPERKKEILEKKEYYIRKRLNHFKLV